VEEAHLSMNNLATTVQTIVESSEKMTHKLENIEQTLAAPSQYATSTISTLPRSSDEALINTALGRDIKGGLSSAQTHMPSVNSDLDLELSNSRVYLRTCHRHSLSSLLSSSVSASGWSFLSGISLAQVSNISLLSLPLYPHEIWNYQHYESLYTHDGLDGFDVGNIGIFKPFAKESKSAKRNSFECPRLYPEDISLGSPDIVDELERDRDTLNRQVNILLLGKSR